MDCFSACIPGRSDSDVLPGLRRRLSDAGGSDRLGRSLHVSLATVGSNGGTAPQMHFALSTDHGPVVAPGRMRPINMHEKTAGARHRFDDPAGLMAQPFAQVAAWMRRLVSSDPANPQRGDA